jgi:hypothetical protein
MKKIKYLSIAVFALMVGLVSTGAIAGESTTMTKGVIVGD